MLRWGNVRRRHWAHLRQPLQGDDACRAGGEGECHRMAKLLLRAYLERGKYVRVMTTCSACKDRRPNVHSCDGTPRLTVASEFPLGGGRRADVALVREQTKEVVCAFEVLNTHPTAEAARPGIQWYEIRAPDILDAIGEVPLADAPQLITLQCHRTGRRCRRCAVAADSGPRARETNGLGKIQLSNIAESLGLLDRVYGKPLNETHRELLQAEKGSVESWYTPEQAEDAMQSLAHDLVDDGVGGAANHPRIDPGYYYRAPRKGDVRFEDELPYVRRDLWDEIKRRGECVRCRLPGSDVGFMRPYCRKCFVEARDDDLDEVDAIGPPRRGELSTKYAWLKTWPLVADDSRAGGRCAYRACEGATADNPRGIYWWGEMRDICPKCAHAVANLPHSERKTSARRDRPRIAAESAGVCPSLLRALAEAPTR